MSIQLEIPLFPLGAVLFSGGFLSLHIFEPRYFRMIENALESETGFGVVLIREGTEVHQDGDESSPAIFETGTLASIIDSNRLPDRRFQILAEGGAKFRVLSTWQQDDHLLVGQVSLIPEEAKREVRDVDGPLVELLRVAESQRQPRLPSIDYTDATAVSLRLPQHLPMDVVTCQSLLQLENSHLRMDAIREWLQSQRNPNG